MSTTHERLLLVQERDRRIAQLLRESKDIPARKQDLESRLTVHRDALHQAQEDIKKIGGSTRQIEGDVEALKEKIRKFREQQFQIKSNEEYRALEHEISLTQHEIDKLEDRELQMLEQADEVRRVMARREEDLKKEDARVQQDLNDLDRRLDAIKAEVHDLKIDRDALAADVDADSLARYERIMEHVGDFAIVTVESGVCSGCHMRLPPQVVKDVRKSLSLMTCSFCGRLLYWKP